MKNKQTPSLESNLNSTEEKCPWCKIGTVECDSGIFWCTHCDYPYTPEITKAIEEEHQLRREEVSLD